MNVFRKTLALSTLAVTFSGVAAFAQHDDHHMDWDHHDNHTYVRHDDWKAGGRMPSDYWSHGEHVDYRERHLPPPRRGYEWRQVDGNYVMAAVATGVIASVIAANH